jgi:hypothetical protein
LLLFGPTFATATDADDDELVRLARSQKQLQYDRLNDQERQAFDTFFVGIHREGEAIFANDFVDASEGNSWGPERTVKATWIDWICKDPAIKMVQPSRIRIVGAKIAGNTHLSGLHLEFPLEFNDCYLTDSISLRGANVRQLDFSNSYIDYSKGSADFAIDGTDLTVQGSVTLLSTTLRGGATFINAKISGHFHASDINSPTHALLRMDWVAVNGEVRLDDVATFFIYLNNAQIKGDLIWDQSNGLTTCSGRSMRISGNLIFDSEKSPCGANISSSIINGDLVIRDMFVGAANATVDGDVYIHFDADYETSPYASLVFSSSRVGGTFNLTDFKSKELGLDLSGADVRVLLNPEGCWPASGHLDLQGFVFNKLKVGPGLNSKTQIAWLRLQHPFVSQPYQQMVTVFRNMGYHEDALNVGIAEKWDEGVETIRHDWEIFLHSAKHGQIMRLLLVALRIVFYDVLWFFLFGWLIGYGYRPWNALLISIGFIGIGTFVFRVSERVQVLRKNGEDRSDRRRYRWRRVDRNFSAFIYSLETFIPLVKLGVADQWKIDANAGKPIRIGRLLIRAPGILVLWYYRLHIMAGWVFTSLWVAAFTGILKH